MCSRKLTGVSPKTPGLTAGRLAELADGPGCVPLVLAYQLKRSQRNTWLKHIKPAADFIVRYGPATGQDRWEEKPGYSPATIAAEIAGLVCAARIAEISGDAETAASYRKVADDWAATVDR